MDPWPFTFSYRRRPALAARNSSYTALPSASRRRVSGRGLRCCVRLAATSLSMKDQAQVFTKWCTDNDIDCVMAINSEGILSAIPHLPAHIRVLSRCANAFDHGYRITMSGRERLARIRGSVMILLADYG